MVGLMKRRKFTLIELLVVVAIIGILASMLLPSLAKAREASKVAVCISNQSQIFTAISMYADDNNSFMPKSKRGSGEWLIYQNRTTPNSLGFLMHEKNYLDSAQVFYCPSWKHPVAQFDVKESGGSRGGWPAEGNLHPSSWTWASLAMRLFPELGSERPVHLNLDESGTAVIADHWTARSGNNSGWAYGNGHFGHQTKYVTTYLNGATKTIHDKAKKIISLSITHGSHDAIENTWRSEFDMK